MTKDEIIETGISYISQSLGGLNVENPKFDFKAKWYNLKDEVERNEFLKDTCAIANTFGPDGFIVIGFNDKNKEFENSPLSESGLRDSSDIPGMINRHVDRLFLIDAYEFKFDGNILTILHIPPSIDKPHVIRCYKNKSGKDELNKIFIRRNTSTVVPNKNDFELMFYDRKNVVPEYLAYVAISVKLLNAYLPEKPVSTVIKGILSITIENAGRRPLPIQDLRITLSAISDSTDIDIICSSRYGQEIIGPGDVSIIDSVYETSVECDTGYFNFYIQEFKRYPEKISYRKAIIRLTNGNEINADLTVFK